MSATSELNRIVGALADGVKITRTERATVRAYLQGEEDCAMADRADEVGFRTHVPPTVAGLSVLQVSHFRPGTTPGQYAQALVITYDTNTGLLSTHQLAYRDDPDAREWFLHGARYGFNTRVQAEADVIIRANLRDQAA